AAQSTPPLPSRFALVEKLGANDVQFDIETKIFPHRPNDTVAPEVFVDTLLAAIRSAGMTQRVMIQSFDWRTLALVQRLEPGMRTVYLTIESRNSNNVQDPAWTAGRMARDYPSVAAMIKAAGGAIWAPNFNNIDATSAQRAHDLGLQLVPWTVNEAADMRRHVHWCVDGLHNYSRI